MCVTVIIPNYNGRRYIHECLDSLRLQNFKDFKIIVVDNASTDGSAEEIEEEYEEVRLIRNDMNYGFSQAVNTGIRAADTEFVILLNNDAMCEYNFIEELVKGIRKSDRIFSCGAKMIQYHDHKKLDNAGDFYTIFGWAFQRGLDESIRKYKRAERVFSACAGAAIYRRELFDRVGYFDEQHFAYLEDVDLGFRANILGYKNYYLPKAVAYHIGSASSGVRYNKFKVKLAARNSVYVYYKNLPPLQLLLNAPFIAAGHLIKYLFFKKKGLDKLYIEGVVEAYKTLDKVSKVHYDSGNLNHYIWIQMSMFEGIWNLVKGRLLND